MESTRSTWAVVVAFVAVLAAALMAPSFASALSFQPTNQARVLANDPVSGIAVGDFNEDGTDDLAVAEELGPVAVWLDNGDGTFSRTAMLPAGSSGAADVVTGDFNGDGNLDIAYSELSEIRIALGNGDGTFQSPVTVPQFPPLPFHPKDHQLGVGDFHDNGKDDIVVAGNTGFGANEEGLYRVIADTGVTFTAGSVVHVPIAAESDVIGVAVGDYNDDGAEDLALLAKASDENSYAKDYVYGEEGQGDGTFEPAAQPISLGFTSKSAPIAATTANLDGSGGGDLVVTANANGSLIPMLGSSTEFLALAPGDAPHGFIGWAGAAAAADLTGSGLDDVIAGFSESHPPVVDGGLNVALNNGSGGLTTAADSPFSSGLGNFDPGDVVTGDFNGDGTPDLAVASYTLSSQAPSGVVVLINSPQLKESTEELEFGDLNVGESAIRSEVLTGLGGPAAKVSDIEIEGGSGGPFSVVDPSACAAIAYGEECEIEVEFAPTAYEESTGTLEYTTDTDPGGSDVVSSVALAGAGAGPRASLSPASEDFGSVQIGGTPVAKSFTIESLGNEPLSVNKVSLSSEADFKLADPSACVESLAAGSSCEVSVSFDPAAGAEGARSATLTVETDDGTRTAQLSGTATAAPSDENGNGNAGGGGNSGGTSGGGNVGSSGGVTPAAAPTASLKAKALGSVKPGKSGKLKVVITNTGGTALSGLTLTVNVPKTYATAPKTIKVAALAPGKSVTETIVVKVKKNAPKGMKLAFVVGAATGGQSLASGHGVLKVK